MPPRRPVVLVVEDTPGDQELLAYAFATTVPSDVVHVCVPTGEDAWDWLQNDTPRFVLLDLNLPTMSGLDLLQRIKQHPKLRRVPVIVMTTSDAPEDVLAAYDAHANAFLHKPFEVSELCAMVSALCIFWRLVAAP